MAIRIHVTAMRAVAPDEVRAVFNEVLGAGFEAVAIQESDRWVWFTTSVWGVSAGDLNRGLCRLARPALQFTTSDGDRWYLTVHGGPLGQVHFVHEFYIHRHAPDPEQDEERAREFAERAEPEPIDPHLAFLEDDRPAGSQRPPSPFDLIAEEVEGVGGTIPDAFRDAVAGLPYSAAVNRYRAWHAEQVSNALTEAGIAHDPAAVRSVLLWENITESERGSDLGNLPRLLAVLGLGGQWDDWVRQAESPPAAAEEPACSVEEPDEESRNGESEDRIGPVLAAVEPLGLTPVAGGAVPLALKRLSAVRFFPEACSLNEIAGVVLAVSWPRGFDREGLPAPEPDGSGTVEITPEGFRVGLPNHLWLGMRELRRALGKPLGRLLSNLPDGAVLDIAFGSAAFPAQNQRYRGSVTGGVWQIAETFPALTHDVLTEALDLARQADRGRVKVRDDAEAEAILQAARRDPNLHGLDIERRKRSLRCESDFGGHLARLVFRRRFPDFWSVAAVEQEAEKRYLELLEMRRKMRRAGAEAARRRAAPHEDEFLLIGTASRYWRSDFTQLTELEQETRQKFDAALEARGFRHLGDFVAKKQRDVVLRTFLSPDQLSDGILMGKRTMYLGHEFVSRFADGSSLTTTTNAMVESRPETGDFYKSFPGLEPDALYEKHLWGLGRFRTRRGTEPVPLDPTLVGLARSLDAAFLRAEAHND